MTSLDRFRVSFVCRSGDQIGLVVIHYNVAAHTVDGVTAREAADFFSNRASTAYKAWLPSTAEYRGVILQQYVPDLGFAAQSVVGAGVGTAGALQEPRMVSGVISWRTDFGGRENRGRSYPPFVASQNVQNVDQLTANGLTALATVGTAMTAQAVINGVNGTITAVAIVQHKKNNNLFAPMTSSIPRQILGTQRRRGPFGRPNAIPLL